MSDSDNESTTPVIAAENVDDILALEELTTLFHAGY